MPPLPAFRHAAACEETAYGEMLRLPVLHGPNLNLLGTREESVYGTTTLAEVDAALTRLAGEQQIGMTIRQSNLEGELVTWIQQAKGHFDGIVINPAGYTHTSVAMRDALAAVSIPFIEVHLSNVYARESFRQRSYFSDLAVGVVSGLGAKGYEIALAYALTRARGA